MSHTISSFIAKKVQCKRFSFLWKNYCIHLETSLILIFYNFNCFSRNSCSSKPNVIFLAHTSFDLRKWWILCSQHTMPGQKFREYWIPPICFDHLFLTFARINDITPFQKMYNLVYNFVQIQPDTKQHNSKNRLFNVDVFIRHLKFSHFSSILNVEDVKWFGNMLLTEHSTVM